LIVHEERIKSCLRIHPFFEDAIDVGLDIDLKIWDGMFHGFQWIPFFPETIDMNGSPVEFMFKNIRS
jgi:hypothetical protein